MLLEAILNKIECRQPHSEECRADTHSRSIGDASSKLQLMGTGSSIAPTACSADPKTPASSLSVILFSVLAMM